MIDDIDQLVLDTRRQWGDRLPVPARDESAAERELRERATRDTLERVVLPELERQRAERRADPLDADDRALLVDLVISEVFGLPRLLNVLRDPMVTDVLVFGCDPVRVERADGSHQMLPPLVRRDRDLERIIYDTATARRRPFNRENPFVDLELEAGVRFHGEGFDVVQRPLVTIRRASVFGSSLVDLVERNMLSSAAARLLQAAVAADLNLVICGRMGAGKTTLLRSLVHEIGDDDVIVTVETDFELNVAALGRHPYVHAYQARLPSTSDGAGISCEAMMVPALRTRADWIVVGEVRGAESGALVQAMSIGQGAMATVHGGSARDGIERLAELIAFHTGVELRTARWQVYRSVDLVVHVDGDNRRGRRVTEIVAPGVEEDGARFVVHRLFASATAGGEALPTSPPQRAMLDRLTHADPDFDTTPWLPASDEDNVLRASAGGRRLR